MTKLYAEPDMDDLDRADYDRVGLFLLADRIEREDGTIVPFVTAQEFRAYIAAGAADDYNGTYNTSGAIEGDGAMKYADTDGNVWLWSVAGMTDDNRAMYRITDFGQWYA